MPTACEARGSHSKGTASASGSQRKGLYRRGLEKQLDTQQRVFKRKVITSYTKARVYRGRGSCREMGFIAQGANMGEGVKKAKGF